MSNLSITSRMILALLRNNHESTTTELDTGKVWGTVCLDNARPKGFDKHKFAGHLSALEAKGFYKSEDQYFGEVLLK